MSNDTQDTKMEHLLRMHQPPQPQGLEQRILAAATPRTQRLSPWQALVEMFHAPQLAALACSLILGLLVSRHMEIYDPAPQMLSAPKLSHNAGSFLYYNGEVL